MAQSAKTFPSSEDYWEAKRMYMEWHTHGQIAKRLKRSRNTITSWSGRYNWKAERVGSSKKHPRAEPSRVFPNSADYWEAKRLYMEWLTFEQIARILKRSRNTIMSWSRRYSWKAERVEASKISSGSDGFLEAKRLYMDWQSYESIANTLRKSRKTITSWSRRYSWRAERSERLLGSEEYWEAKRLYMNGLTQSRISILLNQPKNTIIAWSRLYDWNAERKERRECKAGWRARMGAVACGDTSFREQRIYLVTGRSRMTRGLDGMAAVIEYRLGMDPYNGDRYVFCGTGYTTIKGIEWRGGGFVVEMRKAQRGRFPWPRTEEKMVEISAEEYRQLMSWVN